MIASISGKLTAISDKYVIIEANGVGYRVTIGEKIRKSISKIGDEVKLFTQFNLSPRDGSVELFGFLSLEELNFFELLTTVSGVGPKSAQTIISSADLQSLQIAIIHGDDSKLSKIAGIGEKTAKRLVLELKNKISSLNLDSSLSGTDMSSREEAIEALVGLGYSQWQAREAVREVSDKAESLEDKIMESLKILGGRR